MATFNKVRGKVQMHDWFLNNEALNANTVWRQDTSAATRHDALYTLHTCRLLTQWNNFNSSITLADRLDLLNFSTQTLEECATELDQTISKLNDAKDALEKQIQDMQINEDCNTECLVLRDRRRGIDFTEDRPDVELRKEQELLLDARKRFQNKVDEAFKQLLLLKDARQRINKDIQDKKATLNIDNNQIKLKLSDASLKVDPTRIPRGTTTLNEWRDFTRMNLDIAAKAMDAAVTLRCRILRLLEEMKNALKAQSEAVDFALRERVHELLRALSELKWQKKRVEDEIEDVLKQLAWLEEEMNSELQVAKIAHTRLENRTYRPGMELCRDVPQFTLTGEVRQLDASREALKLKQRQCRHQLDGLQRQLQRLEADIAVKENSLRLDQDCLALRRARINGSGQLHAYSAVDTAISSLPNGEEVCPNAEDHLNSLTFQCPAPAS